MNILWVIPIMIAVLFAGCKKDEEENLPTEVEVSFNGELVVPSTLKTVVIPDCTDEIVDYAEIVISNGTDEETYYVEVFYLTIDGVEKPYTQSIKLDYEPGITYTVEKFLFWDDNETPDDTNDDMIIAATPETGSDFASYINNPVSFQIAVEEFEKTQVPVEVICFQPDIYDSFGFVWFIVDEVTIREECFFGDICVKNPDEYTGSLYENQSNGLQIDMPAIAKIELHRNGDLVAEFNNESYYGEGAPLCVTYADYDDAVDVFDFVLYILVKDGEDFNYKHFKTWTIEDDEIIPQGTDGIVDYVLGTCVPDADYIFNPYMNLPATATFEVGTTYAPGNEGGYLDGILSGIGAGYDIYNGTYASWCFDYQVTITPGTSHDMDVYSSLYLGDAPGFVQTKEWNRANWIMNHLDWYDGYTWDDIQGAFWLLDGWSGSAQGGMPALSTLTFAQDMHDDAMTYGEDYLPLPGGYAAVVFVKENTGDNPIIQTVFIVVDP